MLDPIGMVVYLLLCLLVCCVNTVRIDQMCVVVFCCLTVCVICNVNASHSICNGFQIMRNQESSNIAFSMLRTSLGMPVSLLVCCVNTVRIDQMCVVALCCWTVCVICKCKCYT